MVAPSGLSWPADGLGRVALALAGVVFVVLLDLRGIVKVVDHQRRRFLDAFVGGVSERAETFDAGAVGEMEMCHRVGGAFAAAFVQEVVRAEAQQDGFQ